MSEGFKYEAHPQMRELTAWLDTLPVNTVIRVAAGGVHEKTKPKSWETVGNERETDTPILARQILNQSTKRGDGVGGEVQVLYHP